MLKIKSNLETLKTRQQVASFPCRLKQHRLMSFYGLNSMSLRTARPFFHNAMTPPFGARSTSGILSTRLRNIPLSVVALFGLSERGLQLAKISEVARLLENSNQLFGMLHFQHCHSNGLSFESNPLILQSRGSSGF